MASSYVLMSKRGQPMNSGYLRPIVQDPAVLTYKRVLKPSITTRKQFSKGTLKNTSEMAAAELEPETSVPCTLCACTDLSNHRTKKKFKTVLPVC